MGLDQYAFRVSPEMCDGDFGIKNDAEGNQGGDEIQYWRKNRFLHNFMHELYTRKGGTGEFNCVPLRLTLEDLDELEKRIREDDLDSSPGFFFGNQDYNEFYRNMDLDFIKYARSIINEEGNCVYYDSWW